MNIPMYWFKCPNGHDRLIDEEQAKGLLNIVCYHCGDEYTVDKGTLGKIELVREAFPNLRG